MNNPTPLGLRVALAVSAGGVLVRHPLYSGEAPHAYSDITSIEAGNQKILREDKAATPQPCKPLHAVGLLIWNCFALGTFSNSDRPAPHPLPPAAAY